MKLGYYAGNQLRDVITVYGGVVEWTNISIINRPVRLLAKKNHIKNSENERRNYEFVKKNVKLDSTNL